MKSTKRVFLRITLALLFCLAMFGSVNSTSAAGGNRCKDRCNDRYHREKDRCDHRRGEERRRCERRADEEHDQCRKNCR